MEIETVSSTDQTLLRALRDTLDGADEALLCVAFVHSRGVHLVERELKALGNQARLVVTTTFDQSGGHALAHASTLGTRIRTLNPGGGTYHPKLYLARHGGQLKALVGSANLTGGLATNVELAVRLRGQSADASLSRLSTWAEDIWSDSRCSEWLPSLAEARDDDEDRLAPELLAAIFAEQERDPVFRTLGSSKPNLVTDVSAAGLHVETSRSRARSNGPQFIPAWMFNLAWDYLRTHGALTNGTLLNHLRVHRSSAVCAVLARVPGVEVAAGRTITLRLSSARGVPHLLTRHA